MQFEFSTAGKIVFGQGSINFAISLIKETSKNIFLIIGKNKSRINCLIDELNRSGINTTIFQISSEPTIEQIESAVALVKESGADLIVGIGGGSVIDAGKSISAMATNPGKIIDYLEVIGGAKPLQFQPLFYIAIPTTAGTGAEVTRNAVITSKNDGVKASLRHQFLLPRVAIVDPNLTLTLPPQVTAETGLDALTQLIEAFISVRANPITDAFCLEGLKRAGRSLIMAYEGDVSAREDMAMASLLSGLALANSGLGAVHGFAAPIGGLFNVSHGAVCAALISASLIVNISALNLKEKEHPALNKLKVVAQLLTRKDDAEPEDAIEWLWKACALMKIRSLKDLGIGKEDFPTLVEKAQNSSSMKGNPIKLTVDELYELLELAY